MDGIHLFVSNTLLVWEWSGVCLCVLNAEKPESEDVPCAALYRQRHTYNETDRQWKIDSSQSLERQRRRQQQQLELHRQLELNNLYAAIAPPTDGLASSLYRVYISHCKRFKLSPSSSDVKLTELTVLPLPYRITIIGLADVYSGHAQSSQLFVCVECEISCMW